MLFSNVIKLLHKSNSSFNIVEKSMLQKYVAIMYENFTILQKLQQKKNSF